MLCFPRENKDTSCERAFYLLRSLCSKNDTLLLQINLVANDTENVQVDGASKGQHATRQALLHSGAHGCGTLHILDDFPFQEGAPESKCINGTSTRPFNMTMMEKALGSIGAFVDQHSSHSHSRIQFHLEEIPVDITESFTPPQELATAVEPR